MVTKKTVSKASRTDRCRTAGPKPPLISTAAAGVVRRPAFAPRLFPVVGIGTSAGGLPALERFFLKEDGGYRIKKDIREMVIFAPQNVLKDLPFTKTKIFTRKEPPGASPLPARFAAVLPRREARPLGRSETAVHAPKLQAWTFLLGQPEGLPEGSRRSPGVFWERRPPYSFSGLIHRLGWDPSTSSPAQPVNKSVRAANCFGNLDPAPVRIATSARATSCSRSLRPEPESRPRIRILRCRHSTSCTIRTAPRAQTQTIKE